MGYALESGIQDLVWAVDDDFRFCGDISDVDKVLLNVKFADSKELKELNVKINEVCDNREETAFKQGFLTAVLLRDVIL
jgi:hypothetical protein